MTPLCGQREGTLRSEVREQSRRLSLLALWSENNPGVFGWRRRAKLARAQTADVDGELPGRGCPGANLRLRCFALPAGSCLCRVRAARAVGGQRSQLVEESDSFSACFQTCMSPIDRHRLVSDIFDGRCTLHAHGSTNS